MYRGARILILDEPTAVLTPQETEQLFATLRGLRARGTTILLITHKLKEIMALCDAVTVMRAGQVVLDAAIADTSIDGLAEAMVGRRVNLGREARAGTARAPCCCRRRVCHGSTHMGVPRLADVSLTLRSGEIVGIAGVSGNGQSELLDAPQRPAAADRGTLHGRQPHHFTPRALDRHRGRRATCGLHTCPKTATAAAWCCLSRPGSRPCSATSAGRATACAAGCADAA